MRDSLPLPSARQHTKRRGEGWESRGRGGALSPEHTCGRRERVRRDEDPLPEVHSQNRGWALYFRGSYFGIMPWTKGMWGVLFCACSAADGPAADPVISLVHGGTYEYGTLYPNSQKVYLHLVHELKYCQTFGTPDTCACEEWNALSIDSALGRIAFNGFVFENGQRGYLGGYVRRGADYVSVGDNPSEVFTYFSPATCLARDSAPTINEL